MAKKYIDLIQVQEAIRKLREKGEKVNRRNVWGLVGGSMTTIHRFVDEAMAIERALASGQAVTLSDGLTVAILAEIERNVQSSTEELKSRIASMDEREQELLADLGGAEERIAGIEQDLAAVHATLAEERQRARESAAVAEEKILRLQQQVEKLLLENNELVRAGESARVEASKAEILAEQADIAMVKAETRSRELEGRLSEISVAREIADRAAAVAERHAQDLAGQTVNLEDRLEKMSGRCVALEAERGELARAMEEAVSVKREAEAKVGVMDLRIKALMAQVAGHEESLQKGAVTTEQLRQELESLRKTAAEADKRAALAEQKLLLNETRVTVPGEPT